MTSRSTAPSKATSFRPEIQALRALAVIIVILYHLWPSRLPGGYVGVDVFFVISGYLITGQLWRSASGGRLSLQRFYARRVRRLAPASLVVLLFVIVATYLVVPFGRWVSFAKEIVGSVLLSENWVLAANSVDYLAADSSPSPVQHFWTLSVEEQFYFVWPIIILIVLWALRRQSPRVQLYATTAALGAILLASLAYCVWLTGVDPAPAYFVTPVRVWQFAAGGILALIHLNSIYRGGSGAGEVLSRTWGIAGWVGLTGLVAAAFVLDAAKYTYPGAFALIPVLGTLLVIAGGHSTWKWGPRRLMALRPGQYVGDISYSVYLWHWPLIVLAPFVIGDLTFGSKVFLLILALVVGAFSTHFIENPVRFSPRLSKQHVLTVFVAASVAAIFIAAPSVALASGGVQQTAHAKAAAIERLLGGDPCFGALAMTGGAACSPLEGQLTAAAATAAGQDVAQPFAEHCIGPLKRFTGVLCHEGDAKADRSVLVWGDSHAAAWANAFDVAGQLAHFRVIVGARQGCPATLASPVANAFQPISRSEQGFCSQRNRQMLKLATTDKSIDTVVLSSFSTNYSYAEGKSSPERFSGTIDLLATLARAGLKVVVLGDVPLTGHDSAHRIDIPECLSAHLHNPSFCNNPAKIALNTQSLVDAIRSSRISDAVRIVDPSREFCDKDWCYSVLGGVPVFTDASHISGTFSKSLGPWVAADVLGPPK